MEFESRVEGQLMIYRLSFVPDESQPFSILTLLDWLQFDDIKSGLPDFFTNFLDSITLTRFTLGWNGRNESNGSSPKKSFDPKPSVVELVSKISTLTVIPKILELVDIRTIFRIDRGESQTVFVDALGTLEIGSSLVSAHFTMGKNPALSAIVDPTGFVTGSSSVVFEIKCIEDPLTLEDVLGHYLKGLDVLPAPFDTLVTKLGLKKLLLTIEKNPATKKNELSLLMIELSLDDVDINLFGI